jgi:hypothetical protein
MDPLFAFQEVSMLQRLFTGLVCVVLISFEAQAGDWTQWRGPNHNNVAAAGQGIPTEWSESKNILWKAHHRPVHRR